MRAAHEGNGRPAPVGEDDVLMVLPGAVVVGIEEQSVLVSLPGETGGLRLRRGVYDIYRAFHLPRRVAEVLPDDPARRAKVLEVVRQLAAKGFLVPPEVGIPPLAGEPAPRGEPDELSVLA
jgi:hypothetical protein